MLKRTLSLLLAFMLCVGLFPITAYAKESKAYKKYQEAMQATTASGSWSEKLTMTANMAISDGSAKMKTKATITSDMDISNYDEKNLSGIKMSGSASMSVMGQAYAWDIVYENGIAHYTYTEPNQTSADLEMDPSYFNFDTMTEDMMTKAKVSGNKITFTIPGEKMEEAGIAAVNLMSGIEDLDYDDVDVEVIIDKETGTIDKMVMTFHASLTYQGYDAEVDYQIDYAFSPKSGSIADSENGEPSDDSSTISDIDARAEWIKQHMEYAVSDEYQSEIVPGFIGDLNDLFVEIRDSDMIKAYSTLDSVNQILDFDLDLSESQEYELLLAQIFFSYIGEDAIEEIYAENLAKTVIILGDAVLPLDDLKKVADSDQLKAILDTIKGAKGVEEINKSCEEFFNFWNGCDNLNIKKFIAENIPKESFNLAWDMTVDSLDLVQTTLKELTMYVAVGEAYAQTSDAFGNMLLAMRQKINVPSDNPEFNPVLISSNQHIMTNEFVWNLMGTGSHSIPNPLSDPVVLKDLATAIENFYTSIQTYKNNDASYIAQSAISDLVDGTVHDVLVNNCANAAVSLLSCLPIIKQYKQIKDILSTGQAAIDLLTSIDDQEYLGTMVLRLYCISYLQFFTVDSIASPSSSWSTIPLSIEEIRTGATLGTADPQKLREYQFSKATTLDEAVSVYKSISSVAADYAVKYFDIFLVDAVSELEAYDSNGFHFIEYRDRLVETVNAYKNAIKKMEDQKAEILAIACHDPELHYDPLADEITRNFSDAKLYVVACPVDVIVKNESGEQIAYLSGEENEILDGYEFYFHTIKIQDDSGEYIKVAIVPNNYRIEMKGTNNGVMNAFVTDFTTGDVGEVETFFNIPVRKNANGYFKVNADGSGDSTLVMSRKTYSNMTTVEDIPVTGQQDDYLILIVAVGVVAGILVVLLLLKAKHSKR